jgi:hypothetical protein
MIPECPSGALDCVRHGTIDLFAALNIATGKVIGELSAQVIGYGSLRFEHGVALCAVAFGQRLRTAGLLGSMGDCYDNSLMQSFFGPLQLGTGSGLPSTGVPITGPQV